MRSSPPTEQGGLPPRSDREKGTLNKNFRKKELHRITAENQRILRRIQHAPPTYDHVAWEESHRQQESYLRKVCERPLVLRTPRGTPRSGGGPTPRARPQSQPPPQTQQGFSAGVVYAGALALL